jgi:hypothetical protein
MKGKMDSAFTLLVKLLLGQLSIQLQQKLSHMLELVSSPQAHGDCRCCEEV